MSDVFTHSTIRLALTHSECANMPYCVATSSYTYSCSWSEESHVSFSAFGEPQSQHSAKILPFITSMWPGWCASNQLDSGLTGFMYLLAVQWTENIEKMTDGGREEGKDVSQSFLNVIYFLLSLVCLSPKIHKKEGCSSSTLMLTLAPYRLLIHIFSHVALSCWWFFLLRKTIFCFFLLEIGIIKFQGHKPTQIN